MLFKVWEQLKSYSNKYTQPHKRNRLQRYLFPLILLTILISVRHFFASVIRYDTPFLTISFVIILSAWFGGLGPGILTTILGSFIIHFLYVRPNFLPYEFESILQMAMFLTAGFLISVISEAKRQTDIQKDEFIAFVSHEMKNPLTVIKGYAELIHKQGKIAKNKFMAEAGQTIEVYADKTTQLVNELNEMTKIDSGKITVRKKEVNIVNLVKKIANEQRTINPTHKIVLKKTTSKKIAVKIDDYRISQILINLISNSVKYSSPNTSIFVGLQKNPGNIIITVRDHGKGISPQDQERIFDRYYRTKDASKIEGLGLGLFISSEIARLHKGSLWVESQPGKGSTFYLKLPR